MASANNGGSGVLLSGSPRQLVGYVTAIGNARYGVEIPTDSPGTSLVSVVVANNAIHGLETIADGTRVFGIASTENGHTGIRVLSHNNHFGGAFVVGANVAYDCYVSAGATAPGLDDPVWGRLSQEALSGTGPPQPWTGGPSMHAAFVTFKPQASEEEFMKAFGEKMMATKRTDGLFMKTFMESEDGRWAGFYLFGSRPQAEAYLASDFFKTFSSSSLLSDVKVEHWQVDPDPSKAFGTPHTPLAERV